MECEYSEFRALLSVSWLSVFSLLSKFPLLIGHSLLVEVVSSSNSKH